jgi:hypothetical protein
MKTSGCFLKIIWGARTKLTNDFLEKSSKVYLKNKKKVFVRLDKN